MRAFARGATLIVLVVPSALAAGFLALCGAVAPSLGRRAQPWLMRTWFRILQRLFGLRVRIRGAPATAPVLVASNHVSWLDIVVLGAAIEAAFVSKAEIDRWPLVGYFARHGGRTLFVSRGELRSFHALGGELVERLRGGGRVIFFPEGTVGDPRRPLRFKPRLFAAALEAECLVQPVALSYTGGDGAEHAPMGGDDVFVGHLARMLRCRTTDVELCFLEPVSGTDPRALAAHAHAAVSGRLGPGGRAA